MHSLTPDYLAKLRFDTQQLATLRALGEYRGKQLLYVAQSPEVLSDLRQVAVVESTESSNRLEGVVVAAHRLKSLVLKNGVDLFSLPKVTVGKLALAWGWLRKPMIPLVFLLTFQFPFEGAKA